MHKTIIFSTLIILFTDSCNTFNEKDFREKVLSVAEDYVKGQLNSDEKIISETGIITIGDSVKRYIIDPSAIFNGQVDDNKSRDAIVTLVSYDGKYLGVIEHLIILDINGDLMMQRSVESDMRILDLSNRVVTAELPTHPRTSPLFNCPSCREIVRYRYESGELVKTE